MENPQVTTHLKLPFQFDVEKLEKELATLLETKWIPHFNKNGYNGNWNSIALYAKDGDENNIFAMPNEEIILKETPLLKNSKYLKEVIQHFNCPLLSVRLLKLGVGAYIKPHRDYKLGYEDNNFRLHIPIVTNPNIEFILDGVRLNMMPGECWYTNVNYVHSVSNKGSADRIHLVIDGERNDWSDELFFSLAPKESFFPKKENNYSIETMQKMINELKSMNSQGAQKLIEDLQYQIQNISS